MKTCPMCGFDDSTDYKEYPTLSQAPAGRSCRRHFAEQEELEALRQQYLDMCKKVETLCQQQTADHGELEALRKQRTADREEIESLRQQVAELKVQSNEEAPREPEKERSWFARTFKDKSVSIEPTNEQPNTLILENVEEFRATEIQRQTVEHLVVNGGVFVRQETFKDFCNLRTVRLADSIQAIYENTFRNCPKLEKITFGKRLEGIWTGAFRNCVALKELKFPEKLSDVDSYAFEACTSLASVSFPESIWRVSSHAFANCSSLSEVTGLSKCKSVDGTAFENTPLGKTWKR